MGVLTSDGGELRSPPPGAPIRRVLLVVNPASRRGRRAHRAALEALREFEAWSIRSVPRAQNAGADALVNQALDGA